MTTEKKSRNPWPAAIIGYFIVFGAFITIYIAWAVHQREDLVAENYYDNEVRYQEQIDRLEHSKSLSAKTIITYDAAQRSIVIALPAAQAFVATGSVHLYRPSDSLLDRDLPLAVNPDGVQKLDARELRTGLWKVRVQWSAGGREYFLDQRVVVPKVRS